jgi:glutamate-1-semialdehyde 2,1-aminomutase
MEQMAPLGPVYQAGTLSGNPLAMAAGLAMLRELRESRPYDELERRAARLESGLRDAAEMASVAVSGARVGSMMTMFFTRADIHDYTSAKTADTGLYGRYFRAMLERGYYFAPSQFEAAFVSTAHTDEDLDRTVEAAGQALRSLAG